MMKSVPHRMSNPKFHRTALARSLSDTSKATLLVFYSRSCPLCQALQPRLEEIITQEAWLDVVQLCGDEFHLWAPEMFRYGVEQVPCLVLLNHNGAILFKKKAACENNIVFINGHTWHRTRVFLPRTCPVPKHCEDIEAVNMHAHLSHQHLS
jgi:hypothetical protein